MRQNPYLLRHTGSSNAQAEAGQAGDGISAQPLGAPGGPKAPIPQG